MGIQNYLKRVSKATKDIKSAIEEKGVSVAQCDGFETLADKVRAIQTGSSSEGSSLFTVLAFTSSQTKPSTPTGGSFTASSISYPSGWSDGGGLSKYIWMSYIVFKGDGSVYKNWVSPILVNGAIDDSGDPIDLTDLATKTWVIEQIKNSIKPGGVIDLSNYATKNYVDSKITESTAGVSSINGLTGAISLVKGNDNVTIEEEGKNIKISVNASGTEGDTFKEFILYTTSASDSIAPEIPDADTTWDEDTDELTNLPTGWRKTVVVTTSAKYVWRITGIFSKKTRKISGSWYGPYCITGSTGPKGEDGDEKEYAYALTSTSPIGEYPTVDSTSTDSNGKSNSDDGYLPKIVFSASESVQTTAEKQSPSETKAYLYETSRRIHKGEKLEWAKPTLCAMWTYAGLSDDEIDKIKEEVSSKVADQVSEANTKVANVESRLNLIQGTDGKFTVDATKGIVSAITSYKDENQTSYADIIADAASASISNQVGSKISDGVNETLAGAGLTLDGLKGAVDQWGVFKDGDPSNENTLNYVKQTLNAHDASITSAATSIEKNGEEVASVKNAMTTLDAKTATIENNVSKCQYVWVKRSSTETIPNTDPAIYKIIEDTPYDWDSEKYSTLKAYESSMLNGTNTNHPGKWEKLLLAEELSQIRQTPGEIDLTAISGEQAAGIVIKANNEATGKSTILMSAENVNFSGTINAPDATFENINVINGNITKGTITNAEINSCKIVSQIASKNYDPGTGNWKTKEGFLFDAGGEEFAIYGRSPECATEDPDVVISSTEIKLPAATITGKLKAAVIEASKADIQGIVSATEIDAGKITAGTLSANVFDIKELSAKLIEANSLVSTTIETKDTGNGQVNIANDKIILSNNGNVMLNISGSEIAASESTKTKEFSYALGAMQASATLSISDTESTNRDILTNHRMSYNWSATKSLGNITNANGKLIIAPQEEFTFTFNPAVSAAEYLTTPAGKADVSIERFIGGETAGYIFYTYTLYYTDNTWILRTTSGDDAPALVMGSRAVICSSDSAEVKYLYTANVQLTFTDAVDSSDFDFQENYDTASFIGHSAVQGKVTFQIAEQAQGVSIGSNGFKVALDGVNKAQFTKTSTTSSFILETQLYGIEINSSNLWLKVGGIWYTPTTSGSVGSRVLTFTETTKS